MLDDDREEGHKLKTVTFKLSEEDIAALQRITKRRYPKDTNRMTQALRDMIREEDTRGTREEPGQ